MSPALISTGAGALRERVWSEALGKEETASIMAVHTLEFFQCEQPNPCCYTALFVFVCVCVGGRQRLGQPLVACWRYGTREAIEMLRISNTPPASGSVAAASSPEVTADDAA